MASNLGQEMTHYFGTPLCRKQLTLTFISTHSFVYIECARVRAHGAVMLESAEMSKRCVSQCNWQTVLA
jgi:hypothetical protein